MLFFAGIFICGQTARDVVDTAPGIIIFDEVVGFLVAMFLMPFDITGPGTEKITFRESAAQVFQ